MTEPTNKPLDRRRVLGLGLAGLAGATVGGRVGMAAEGPGGGWDGEAVDLAATLDQPGWAQGVAFSADGKTLAAGGGARDGVAPGWITTWEVGTWKHLRTVDVPAMRVYRLAFAPDGREVVAAGLDESRLILCKLDSGKCLDLVRRPNTGGIPMRPVFSPEGKYLLTSNPDEGITLWTTADWSPAQRLFGTHGEGCEVVIDPRAAWDQFDGRAYALARAGTLFDVRVTGSMPRDVVLPPGARYVGPPQFGLERVRGVDRPWDAKLLRLSPDGRTAALVATANDGRKGWINTYAVDDEGRFAARARIEIDLDAHATYSLAFTPDGRALVAGGGAADKDIRRWDLDNGRALAPLAGHGSSVVDLATSPGGWLASAGNADQTVRIWTSRRPAR